MEDAPKNVLAALRCSLAACASMPPDLARRFERGTDVDRREKTGELDRERRSGSSIGNARARAVEL
jgi:hypothetical protein